jgi:Domain of unknown function (DUF4349)
MRLREKPEPIDSHVAEAIDAIDATLAGEPVDGRHADLAEVALLLSGDRPQAPEAFARSMDERVARRFVVPSPLGAPGTAGPGAAAQETARPGTAGPGAAAQETARLGTAGPGAAAQETARLGTAGPGAAGSGGRRRRSARAWPAMGGLATGVALLVAIVLVTSGGNGPSSASPSSASPSSAPAMRAAAVPHAAAANGQKAAAGSVAASSPPPAPAQTSRSSTGPALQPPTTGRKIVQSAQLNLTAAPNRIDTVAQELYDVIGDVGGIVNSSTVTQGGPAGYASFQLSVPSATLPQTMTRLSQLGYATVVSRTDDSQDITGQFDAATRALADARALRTSLLKQLAGATTTAQIDSLEAQIHDAEASISSDEATLARLNNQVDFSQINVTINASVAPVPVTHGDGFTLGTAAHDAGRVLTVVAGVALIALAALTPVALLVALASWIGATLRRRRREQALDLV